MQGALRVCAGSGCQGAGEGAAAARQARGIGALGSPGQVGPTRTQVLAVVLA